MKKCFQVEWTENGIDGKLRIYLAKDVAAVSKALIRMNQARVDDHRPVMKKITITELKINNGEYPEITGDYYHDLMLDA